jgi:hypothetical protein
VVGIILLFFRPRPKIVKVIDAAPKQDKPFAQVISASLEQVRVIWENGDSLIPKSGLNCPAEIKQDKEVGRSYYQCQPHFWQCYWTGGIEENPTLKIELSGQTYHVVAEPVFPAITQFSSLPRYYEFNKAQDLSGIVVSLAVQEFPGESQFVLLKDTCRDVYLPQRIYGYGKSQNKGTEGFIWDNFDRHLFIDKFYVTNQQVNQWRVSTKQPEKINPIRSEWYRPAILDRDEQVEFCAFHGKRLMEAHLMDAASMAPSETKNPKPQFVNRPQTPWQRDLTKSFLGLARINPDYQLSPLDCQLAQVKGCKDKYFTTDSTSWMGMNYPLGFYPESFNNSIEPTKRLKLSSKFYPPASEYHELGLRSAWNGVQKDAPFPVAFRCYEEVIP